MIDHIKYPELSILVARINRNLAGWLVIRSLYKNNQYLNTQVIKAIFKKGASNRWGRERGRDREREIIEAIYNNN